MKLDVVGKSRLWLVLSTSLIGIGIVSFFLNTLLRGAPMNFGIDFTGGTTLTLRFAERTPNLGDIRRVLQDFKLAQSGIQRAGSGNDIIIRTEPLKTELRTQMLDELRSKFSGVELLEADTIGPVVGKELRTQALWSLLLASLGITLYVTFRFRFDYAIAALLALYHDAIITTGLVALLWRTVDTPFIAAILTIMGYSINDTIVIFDRLRENLAKPGAKQRPFGEVVNASVQQTMGRSINTVLTVIVMNVSLLLFGGTTLKDFALTLLIGFSIGAYSSIFVASPLLVWWRKKAV